MADSVETFPTRPRAFGEELKKLRTNAGVTIDELMAETKVSRRILEALEAGKFQYLPERVFSRNFVKQYAAVVGYDPTEIARAFDTSWNSFLVHSGSHPKQNIPEPPPPSPIKWRFWIPIIVAILAAVIIAVVLIQGTNAEQTLTPDPRRVQTTRPTPTVFIQSFSPTPDQTATETESEVVETTVDVVITVGSGQECWIQYRDRNGSVDSRLLDGGERFEISLDTPALLSLGNAGAATLVVDGNEYSQLGRPGQVVHCELSSEGLVKLGA